MRKLYYCSLHYIYYMQEQRSSVSKLATKCFLQTIKFTEGFYYQQFSVVPKPPFNTLFFKMNYKGKTYQGAQLGLWSNAKFSAKAPLMLFSPHAAAAQHLKALWCLHNKSSSPDPAQTLNTNSLTRAAIESTEQHQSTLL